MSHEQGEVMTVWENKKADEILMRVKKDLNLENTDFAGAVEHFRQKRLSK